MNLNELIRNQRKSKGLTQAELGNAIGKPRWFINRLEKNPNKKLSADDFVKLDKALDISKKLSIQANVNNNTQQKNKNNAGNDSITTNN